MNSDEALDEIASLLDSKEWDTDTLDEVVRIVRESGREVGDVELAGGTAKWYRHINGYVFCLTLEDVTGQYRLSLDDSPQAQVFRAILKDETTGEFLDVVESSSRYTALSIVRHRAEVYRNIL